MTLYPLRFRPIYRRYLWGGRRLASLLGKPLPAGDDYAESWEVVDHGDDQSIVAAGPLEGAALGELVASHGEELLGRHHPQNRFPLLLKFLDAQRNLSVQVHPNDEQAARLDPPDLGKTEAWVVLHAEPGSMIYAGLKRGFDRHALEREVMRGTVELCLHKFEARVGDCVFIPAGTVHALGEGLVIAEIQQASDTTFRLHDWNRVGPDGQPRPLHIVESLEVIDYERGPVDPQTPEPTGASGVERLVACDKFVLDRYHLAAAANLGGDDRFHLLAVIEGSVAVEGDPCDAPLRRGESLLLPACRQTTITPEGDAVVLEMHLP
ncbi:MAG: class I mannose-6-phosphate isomerase [Pirellulaceae bacterium]